MSKLENGVILVIGVSVIGYIVIRALEWAEVIKITLQSI